MKDKPCMDDEGRGVLLLFIFYAIMILGLATGFFAWCGIIYKAPTPGGNYQPGESDVGNPWEGH